MQGLFNHLEEALEARGYFRPMARKKIKMVNNLRGVLTRAGFSDSEMKLLRGVLVSLDYFSPKHRAAPAIRTEGAKREKAHRRRSAVSKGTGIGR